MRAIYLDYNATTPIKPEVLDAMLPYLKHQFGNPSSDHAYGQAAAAAVEKARSQVASLLNCQPEEIYFTSGGTEASNLAIVGTLAGHPRRRIVTTNIEHPATAEPCRWLETQGVRVDRLASDHSGQVSVDEAAAVIGPQTALVTVMHANNETGVLQPIDGLAALARAAGARMHTDAAQSLGKVPIDLSHMAVDLLTIAGHKLYAPKGVGALFVRKGIALTPFTRGAGHERGLRPGTENVASIVGLGAACDAVGRDLHAAAQHMKAHRDALWHRLSASIDGLALHGHPTARLPNTLNVRFPDTSGRQVLAEAPNIAASTGSACHADHEQASSVILALGLSPKEALGAVRLTLGRETSLNDVNEAADQLIAAWMRVRKTSANRSDSKG